MLRYLIQPSFYDLDWMGIVSNISYVRWLEDIRSRLLDASPYPMQRLMAEQIAPAMLTTHVDYHNAYIGIEGGLIEARVGRGEKMGRSRWQLVTHFHHADSDQKLVSATQTGCFVKLPSVRPTRTPTEMSAFFDEHLAPDTDYFVGKL